MDESHYTSTQRLLLALAVLLFALRFLWLGDTLYVLDEPLMQLRIDESFASHVIPLLHSRGSSIPIPYGPGAIWFFMVPRLFTWRPVGIVFYQLCFQLLGYAFFCRAVRKAYGREAFAWCALLLASSPLLFFLARHTWDSPLFVPIGGAILLLLQKLKEGGRELPIHAALGFLGGYAVNTHLMFGPVMLALLGTLVPWNLRRHSLRRRRAWVHLLAFGGGALLVLLPYLIAAGRVVLVEKPMEHARVNHRWGDGRNLWWIFLRTALFNSTFNGRAMLDDLRTTLYAYAGQPFAFFFRYDVFGWFGKLAAWGAAVAVLARLARLRFDDEPLRLFAALTFFFVLLVFQYLNIPMAPHYFLPNWWFVFLGVAVAIRSLRSLWKGLFLASLAGTILVNASYVAFTLAYLHENKGARNMDASVAVSEQLRNLREICAWGRERGKAEVNVFFEHGLGLGETTFDFLPKHMPECAGVAPKVVPQLSQADLLLHYRRDSQTSAALVADPAPHP
jgi:hypothetical protein